MSALPWHDKPPAALSWSATTMGAYESARYEAAMSRLQIALATLKDIRDHAHTLEDAKGYADEALMDMGEMP